MRWWDDSDDWKMMTKLTEKMFFSCSPAHIGWKLKSEFKKKTRMVVWEIRWESLLSRWSYLCKTGGRLLLICFSDLLLLNGFALIALHNKTLISHLYRFYTTSVPMASLDSVIKLWKVVGGNHIGAGRACKLSKLHTERRQLTRGFEFRSSLLWDNSNNHGTM